MERNVITQTQIKFEGYSFELSTSSVWRANEHPVGGIEEEEEEELPATTPSGSREGGSA